MSLLVDNPRLSLDDLSKSALLAATQLDRLERTGHADFNTVNNFASDISIFSGIAEDDASSSSRYFNLFYPEFFHDVLQRTADRSFRQGAIKEELRKIIDEMKSSPAPNDEDLVGRLKRFCLEIHACILSNTESATWADQSVFVDRAVNE